jgi:hypothetical protein
VLWPLAPGRAQATSSYLTSLQAAREFPTALLEVGEASKGEKGCEWRLELHLATGPGP